MDLFRQGLRVLFGIEEESTLKEDALDDALAGNPQDNTPDKEPQSNNSPDTGDNSDQSQDTPDESGDEKSPDQQEAPEEAPEDSEKEDGKPPVVPQAETPVEDDDTKIQRMFKDTGDINVDYSITNENNIKLAKFKFKNAGIKLETIVTAPESKSGLAVDILLSRLTPEQHDDYLEKNKLLRTKFSLLAEREKNIILYNAKIPMTYFDENRELKVIDKDKPELLKTAFEKIDKFISKKYGENWQDISEAISYLQEIKINFGNRHSISPNLVSSKYFAKDDTIAFNKINVPVPESITKFIQENKDNNSLNKSSIFRTISSGYTEDASDSLSVYPIIKPDGAVSDSTELKDIPDDQADDQSDDTENMQEPA